MAFLLVVLALLVSGAACGGGPSSGDRAERAALRVEIRESHAATGAAHDTVAARGEPLRVDVDTLTNNAAAARVAWATQIARVTTNQASVLTQREDAMAGGTWDLHFPYETGASLTPRGIVASVRDAANAEREQAEGVASRGATDAP